MKLGTYKNVEILPVYIKESLNSVFQLHFSNVKMPFWPYNW